MALKKWNTGDTITERSANNKGVRKGLESDITGIAAADKEIGDLYFNEAEFCHQSLQVVTGTKRTNLRQFLAADANEVTNIGTTPTQVKDTSFIKQPVGGFSGNRIFIIAELKTSNGGTTAHLRVRKNGGGSDELDLTTTSTTEVVVKGSFDISTDGDGRITLEFFLDDGTGDTVTNRELEVYGV